MARCQYFGALIGLSVFFLYVKRPIEQIRNGKNSIMTTTMENLMKLELVIFSTLHSKSLTFCVF